MHTKWFFKTARRIPNDKWNSTKQNSLICMVFFYSNLSNTHQQKQKASRAYPNFGIKTNIIFFRLSEVDVNSLTWMARAVHYVEKLHAQCWFMRLVECGSYGGYYCSCGCSLPHSSYQIHSDSHSSKKKITFVCAYGMRAGRGLIRVYGGDVYTAADLNWSFLLFRY